MACMAVVLGLSALPEASADGCTVVVTILGGQTLTFQNVPAGSSVSSLPLPPGAQIVGTPSWSCPTATATTPAATVTATTPAPTTSTSTSTSTTTSTTSKPKGSGSGSGRSTTTTSATSGNASPKSGSRGSGQGKSQKPTALNPGTSQAGTNL